MAQKITNLKMPVLFTFVGLVTILTFQNCAGFIDSDHNSINLPSISQFSLIESEARAILSKRCASCHSPDSEDIAARAAFPDINDHFDLQNRGIIIVGSPQESPLYISIIDRRQPPSTLQSESCDIDPNCVPDDERAVIRDWILGPENYANDNIGNPGGSGGTTPALPVTFASVRSNVITPHCIGCHGGAAGRSDFRTYAGVMAAVNAGAPNTSPLYLRITTTDPNTRMPRNAPPLSGPQIALIRNWISAGAPN